MHFVSEDNKHLLYLDVEIPWSAMEQKSLFIQFRVLTQAGFIQINAKNKMLKKYSGYYWIEDDRTNLKKAWSYFAKTVFNVQREIDLAHFCIIRQLMSGVQCYNTYYFVEAVLISLKNVRPKDGLDPIWKEEMSSMQKKFSLNHCYKLQLIKNIYEVNVNVDQLYDIIKSSLIDNKDQGNTDKEITILKLSDKLCDDVGIGFVYSFIYDVRKLFNKGNNIEKMFKSEQFLKLYPIFNYFRYFQGLRNARYARRYGQSEVIRFNLQISNKWFIQSDKSWMKKEQNIIEILNMDLDISTLNNNKRIAPFEVFITGLISLLCKNNDKKDTKFGIELFRKIIKEISNRKKKKLAQNIFTDMFSNQHCAKYIFNILGSNIDLWKELILILDQKFIKTNKIILDSFITYFKKMILSGGNDCTELQNMCDLISGFSIFDTINVRLALLNNENLVLCKKPDDFNKNIINIMKIVLRGKEMHDSIEKELIKFMSNIFEKDDFRDVGLHVFGQLCNYTQAKLFKMFQQAINKSMSNKNSIPDRFIMYLSCPEFYKFQGHGVHEYYIEKVMEANDKKMYLWSDEQTKSLQALCKKYASEKNKNGVELFNKVLENLVDLPGKQEVNAVSIANKGKV